MQTYLNVVLTMGLVPMLLVLGMGGKLLPTWMFINSLQLMTHIPMIDANVPSDLHYFLANYLSVIRLDSKLIGDSVEAW